MSRWGGSVAYRYDGMSVDPHGGKVMLANGIGYPAKVCTHCSGEGMIFLGGDPITNTEEGWEDCGQCEGWGFYAPDLENDGQA